MRWIGYAAREKKMEFWSDNLKEGDHFEDSYIYGRIILKQI
jgi:hypothetical protein